MSADKSTTSISPYWVFVTGRDNSRKSNLVVFLAVVECWRTPGLCSWHPPLHTRLEEKQMYPVSRFKHVIYRTLWWAGAVVPYFLLYVLIDFPSLFFLSSCYYPHMFYLHPINFLSVSCVFIDKTFLDSWNVYLVLCLFFKIDVIKRWQYIKQRQ